MASVEGDNKDIEPDQDPGQSSVSSLKYEVFFQPDPNDQPIRLELDIGTTATVEDAIRTGAKSFNKYFK